jgi:carboxypeptidase Taq
MRNTLLQRLPNFEELVKEGNLLPIKEWLVEQIYQYGKSLTPAEIIQQVTGEALNPDYLVAYLEEKYKQIYKLA